MRQAIETKYLGATDFRSSRIKATAQAGSVTLSWDDALDVDANHDAAALALADKYEWGGRWIGGVAAGNRGNVYVQIPSRHVEGEKAKCLNTLSDLAARHHNRKAAR